MTGLLALEARVAHDLACLDAGGPDWLAPRVHADTHVFDVAIVGGGQSGLGAAFALRLERVSNLVVLDDNPAGREGPWETYARMRTLRTPKQLTSIDMGVPSLTFRAWWEAQHGVQGWDALGKIGRRDWMAYLRWYRAVLDLPVRNDARVTLVEPLERGLYRLQLDGQPPILARKVVLATGIQGGGEWHVPRFVADAVPPHLYAHTSQAIDYAALAGKRVAVLGGGASAFDNASAALHVGVAAAHVFVRRPRLPRVNPIRFMEASDMIRRFPALDDAGKYAVMASFFDRVQPPTMDMFEEAAAFPGFALHLGSPWTSVREVDGGAEVTTPHGRHRYDLLVLSTGLVTDPALRPELASVHGAIARWRDRYEPSATLRNAVIDAHPYLGPGFEMTARTPADEDALHGLYAFNYSALVSHGLSASALSGLKHALPRLARAIADALFRDDEAEVLARFHAYADVEFTGEWAAPVHEAAA